MVTLFWVCFSAAMRVSLLCRSLMSEYVYLFTITLSTNSPVSDVTTSASSIVNRITSSSVWKQRILNQTSHSAVQRYYNRNRISTSPKLYSIISLTWEESWGDMSKFQNYSYTPTWAGVGNVHSNLNLCYDVHSDCDWNFDVAETTQNQNNV